MASKQVFLQQNIREIYIQVCLNLDLGFVMLKLSSKVSYKKNVEYAKSWFIIDIRPVTGIFLTYNTQIKN